ncbi:glycoside hydrolase family 3 N-terminal domain-containing protein [Salegentibacter sp. F188]|uniref:beta-N-acetylhexosaminidase n=1 Tax=Autumnicola patrickiae TaxID=3075591 RepID=A0ABU3E2P1_9FLAO|nr:glycoside hydrolase family 3 N-terminal domain-containing protein [Salegentibacter sp. F188]MDT0690190.1 glycoside hydrolase family 3 N-terminal domain-containing protein [Salegentibacter sp. F188]
MKLKVAPKFSVLITLFFFLTTNLFSQQRNPLISDDFPAQKEWVDSVYNAMTLEEKIGQLFMVDVFSNAPESKTDEIKKLVEEHHIGGIIFSKGGPLRQAKLTNEFQEASKIPLMIGMDAEWGLAMRLDSTFSLPWNMALGAIRDTLLIEEAGAAISRHSKRLGVHINFAPVVDINTNAENPIIGNRSFGEEKENVTQKSLAFIRGMHREGILSSAKHFPGHGDTDSDSHKTLPTISFSRKRIENIELYPYRKLIEAGLSSVMVAHLNVPSLEEQTGTPSSLSKTVVTDLLKKELGFNGLIFTDALNMKGASNFSNPGDIDLAAFLAGNDVLLISEDVPKGIQKIAEAYNNGAISEQRLSHSVKKILFAKYKVGLNNYTPVNTTYLISELHSVRDDALFEKLTESSITVLKNNTGLLPFKKLADKKFAYVNFGDGDGSAFLTQLRKYTKVDWVTGITLESLLDRLKDYDRVIVGFHKPDHNPWTSYKFSQNELRWIYEIARNNTTVLNVFTSPYSLLNIPTFTDLEGVVVGYQNNEIAQQKVAQVLFGAIKASGKLPVSIGNEFPEGSGLRSKEFNRLSYGIPETVGVNSYKLRKIDSIISEAIEKKMTPGAQILIARKGKVIYNRNFGYQTYDEELPVTDTTVYDLASLTKILATLPLVMEQEEKGIVNFDTTLGEMLTVFQNSNKEDIRLQDMLMHYARLKVWIPFYISTLDKTTRKPSDVFYSKVPSEAFNTHVAKDLYIRNDAQDTILSVIRDSDLEKRKEYKYSDLPFYILKYYLEAYYGTTLNSLTQEKFYRPLGANFTGYLPVTRFGLDQIAPTEDDKLWRAQKIHGYVHDQGAAMQGGIGGHAGLFSNANDVAKIMQMYMNGGSYGGEKFFEPETISKFNTCYYCEQDVRRGVGFDKPQLGSAGPTCGCVSLTSFGHSGFTGTLAWADPEEEIIYVFLSNRTYPDSNNRKLIRADIRSKIQEVIYEAIDY